MISADLAWLSRSVEQAMQKLIDTNVIVRIQNGVYLLNPDILFKGTTSRRHAVMKQYMDAKKKSSIENAKKTK